MEQSLRLKLDEKKQVMKKYDLKVDNLRRSL